MEKENVIYQNCYLDKIIMEKNESFDCLVIKQGTIKHIPWTDPNYAGKLIELDLFKSVRTNSDNFIEVIATNLEVDKYSVPNMTVKNEIFAEEPYYLYEILYIDLEKAKEYHTENNLNELASLVNVNGDLIYSNAIILRSYLPSLTDSMNLCTMTKEDLRRVLNDRVYTKVVTGDDNVWNEERVVGDLNNYAKVYFEDEDFKKLEFPFLMHNINIWYTFSKYGSISMCGNLVEEPVEKCIWFSMKSEEFRGNLTLDEVKKIIALSKLLTDYKTPSELLDEKIDSLGRKIIYNKYKVLDYVYHKFIGSKSKS